VVNISVYGMCAGEEGGEWLIVMGRTCEGFG